MLRFGKGNSKLVNGEIVFDLPAGYTCPFARECLAKAARDGSKLTDGPHSRFRCFAASAEVIFKNAREKRWENFDTIRGRTEKELYDIITINLPVGNLYRIHSSGDFYTQRYFDAWLRVARSYPERIFYAYTKALPFWVKRLGKIPDNFRLVASYGGTHDHLIPEYKLKAAIVVNWKHEAKALGLEIDTDDSHAWQDKYRGRDFALLIHGCQKAGTEESRAWNHQRQLKLKAA